MTTIDARTAATCRHCHAHLHPSGGHWIDPDGWDHCPNGETSHQPATVCRVHDQIMTWTNDDDQLNIREGDLILRDYRFEVVDRLYYTPRENICVRVELAGHNSAFFAQPGDLVAVRRYVTS